jgi:hypothetical protein
MAAVKYLDDILRILRGSSGRTQTLPLRALKRKPHGLYPTKPNYPRSRNKQERLQTFDEKGEAILRELFNPRNTDQVPARGIAQALGLSEKEVSEFLMSHADEIGVRAYQTERSNRSPLRSLPKTNPGFPRMMDEYGLMSSEREAMDKFMDIGREVGPSYSLREKYYDYHNPEEQNYLRSQASPFEKEERLVEPLSNPQYNPGTVPTKEEQYVLELLIENDQSISKARQALKRDSLDPEFDAEIPDIAETAWKYR